MRAGTCILIYFITVYDYYICLNIEQIACKDLLSLEESKYGIIFQLFLKIVYIISLINIKHHFLDSFAKS